MRKLLSLAIAILAASLWAVPCWSAPRLTLPESAFNFGFVPQNAKVSHEFWLHSTGDDLLKILKVVPG